MNGFSLAGRTYWIYFALTMVLVTLLYALYGINVVRWQNSPDFGWWPMYESGPNIVAEVMELGEEAGLKVGDTIQSINGRSYSTFNELFFEVRNDEPGSVNSYIVIRDGKPVEISITTGSLGLKGVLSISGPLFGMSLVYIIIGIIIFLMKPQAKVSWLFLIMTCFLGLYLSYSTPSYLMRPLWLYDVRRFIELIFPATLIHLTLRFPKTRAALIKHSWLWTLPYAVSIVLFILFMTTSSAYWEAGPILLFLNTLYLLLSVIIFLGSTIWNVLMEKSVIVRLQSQVISIGTLIGFLLPSLDLLLRTKWDTYLFPHPDLGIGLSLICFPLSIGYTIVKHDLFAIDVIVRRTYGYVLSIVTIVGAYALIISVLDVISQSGEAARSPLFSIVFALVVVFSFRPLHERLQRFVNNMFYRQKYDYRQTIKDISEAMIRILDPEQIYRRLIGSVVNEMFLENGVLLLPNPDRKFFQSQIVVGDDADRFNTGKLAGEDELTKVLLGRNDAILRHQIEMNPKYDQEREQLLSSFDSFSSELMLPLKYQDEMRGIISLGRKKSGKMFTPEDMDLLKTITNQSVIALENAKLFEENIEKSRMEEELKIAHEIQADMLPKKAPKIEGLDIAANSISAREVGGDFFDFIEMGGNEQEKRLGILVGDVSGKAVSGALVMAASRSTFRVLSDSRISLKEMVTIGNARLKQDVKKGMFVALIYAVIDPKQKTMTLINAGQTQPIVLSNDTSKPIFIDTEGDRFPLGILHECDYQETTVPLTHGNTIVFYTDGIVEAMNDKEEMYGFDRFMKVIDECKGLGSSTAFLGKLMADVTSFVNDAIQHDDLTIVVVKVQ
jgi:serine phosphatase RsbU (regulator of sigma subunit)